MKWKKRCFSISTVGSVGWILLFSITSENCLNAYGDS